jgi:hypothetical protein
MSRGGKREGSGRKPLGPAPLTQYTVRLPAEVAERLRELGNGNLSEGIRIILDRPSH